METLQLAIITDIHHGTPIDGKHGDKALSLLQNFVDAVNQRQPDLVVDLGDRISDIDKPTDTQLQQEVMAIFQDLTVPHVHLLGNHDMDNLTRAENEAVLGVSLEHASQDIKGVHLVFWQPDVFITQGFEATQQQLEWLEANLKSTSLPSIIFTHAPFSDASMLSHFYFQNSLPKYAGYENAAAIRDIIKQHSNTLACISGHVHWNSLQTINGTHHITLQSITEGFTTQAEVAEAWTWLELDTDLRVNVQGKDFWEVRLPLKKAGVNWRKPIVF